MNVYLQEQVTFKTRDELFRAILHLPSFALFQVHRVPIEDTEIYYLLSVYCFDDEVDVLSILD